ncbi:Lrp/AsnC family transcriptional regulator [Chitinophaga pendula]|uniref:Lrp/AsnC family transcriptional regulator n=1 Tax=Chitinophaga TaxID=79328 RepID=UPI000BAFB222|nr:MULTISPECIES: Lrp/AsnC family transcriptional regulator [Chitinophaga]ASZ09715.1 AsnC family transcriptional regulator [Chitinophaga sp. MD30]UCJ07342.1 Lrp/AsnC family transcriptional regulator [Chitinophaga pendula]
MQLDDTDRAILRLLQEDALLSYKEIAARLHLSSTPIFERVKKLEQQGVIKGYVALVDRLQMGLCLLVLCNVSLRDHNTSTIENFEQRIGGINMVLECFQTSGQYDYQIKLAVSSMEEYQQFLKQISDLGYVSDTNSTFILREVVNHTRIPL